MRLGVPNQIVDDLNSDSNKSDDDYDMNPIPTTILSLRSWNLIKIDQILIKFVQLQLNLTNVQLKDWLKIQKKIRIGPFLNKFDQLQLKLTFFDQN